MKAVGPVSVLELIQYHVVITFELRTLNLEPIILGHTYLNQPIIQKGEPNTMADMNKLLGQLLGSGAAGGFACGLASSMLTSKSGRKLGKQTLKMGGTRWE